MHRHLLRTEIHPLHHLERLPPPASHRFEQIGNPRFVDLRFSGCASELRWILEERNHRIADGALDPPLVLLLETQERRAPSAKQMSLGSYDALEARFEGVGPGDYVALIEPMPHLI